MTAAPANTPPGWDGILDPGEQILWQGRPDARVQLRVTQAFSVLFGLAFAGFAVFWMIMAAQSGGLFWMFGLLHFAVGLGVAFGSVFWDAFRRSRTWYTLTNARAFIATDLPVLGRRLTSYPIAPSTALEFDQNTPASLYFAHEHRRTRNGSRRQRIGFERISDGDKVYRLIRQIQKGSA